MKSRTAPAPKPTISEPVPANTKTSHWFLYLTAGVSGAAVMIIEILGAKMLSPYVGLSHFVWTAQIAVTLVALACGYYAGGRLADKSQQISWLYWALLAAAGYMALTVLICAPVAYWCLDFNLAIGSLLASTILFFVPLALLAMTSPFLVRMITSSIAAVGSNVGRLTSISTLGSFFGTLLIGYVMIPYLPNSLTMFFTALLLMLICAVYFGIFRRMQAGPLVLIFLLTLSSGFALRANLAIRPAHAVELFRGNSHFGQLQVIDLEDGSKRYYLNDFLVQNTYDTIRKQSMSQFTYMLSGLARVYNTNIQDVLCIGLGVGIVPMDFVKSGASVDVVEINPAVVPVAARFFNLDTNKIHITIDDGRHFLNRSAKKYDAVVLDAFLGDSSPSHLLTREAFTAIKRVLKPGGVLSINAFCSNEPGHDFFAASLEKTLKAVFEGVRIHGRDDGAFFFAASGHPLDRFARQPDLDNVHPEVASDVQDCFEGTEHTTPDHGIVLTDNYNPVEFFDAKNREDFRRRLALDAQRM